MVESVRAHQRLSDEKLDGLRFEIEGLLAKPVKVFIPSGTRQVPNPGLLIQFNGAAFIVKKAVAEAATPFIGATINLGSGSRVYGEPFEDSTRFSLLLDRIVAGAKEKLGHPVELKQIVLSGFSAGYGAIRNILSAPDHYRRVDGVLLLDGIHASYVPDRTVLALGGRVDSVDLQAFHAFAEDAVDQYSNKKFLITHSEIFPGTYVSTTEATDVILKALDMRRQPMLKWGPLGMQQLSVARKNHFAVYGFAGNTAPDHIDHLHGLYWFLLELLKL